VSAQIYIVSVRSALVKRLEMSKEHRKEFEGSVRRVRKKEKRKKEKKKRKKERKKKKKTCFIKRILTFKDNE